MHRSAFAPGPTLSIISVSAQAPDVLCAQAPSIASISGTHVQASVSAPSPVSDLASESFRVTLKI